MRLGPTHPATPASHSLSAVRLTVHLRHFESHCYSNTHNQRWSELHPLKDDCIAMLEALADITPPGTIDLIMYGFSQGGTSTVTCHMAVQLVPDLANKYNLLASVASAGHYSSNVWLLEESETRTWP